MANGYIGKISALVTASTADLSRKLQGSTGEVRKFAASVQSQVTSASRNAQNSLNSIFTPLQKLERALKAAGGQLNLLKPGQAAEIRAFVSAAEGINKPLEAAQRQFVGLSSEVASRFIPALNRAQEAALQVNEQISRTGTAAAQNFREAQRAVEAFAQSQARVAQIDRAAGGGRTGREAEFVSPRALQTLREAAALSERASQLSPAALQDGGVARQVQRLQTFRNAIARTVAEVEEIRLRPQVDTAALAAAERRLDNIVETTRAAQQELEQIVNRGADAQRRAAAASRFLQVDQRESQLTSLAGVATDRDASGRTIQERVAAINATNQRAQAEANLRSEQERRVAVANTLLQIDQRESQLQSFEGRATDVRARVQAQFEVRRAVEEEAAFRQRAADQVERETAAVERLSQAQNRLLAAEIDRTSGAAARRNAASFDASTADLLRPDDRPRREFGVSQRTRDSELARAAALERQFLSLPDADRNALESQRRGVQAFIESVRSGGTSVSLFTDRLNALEQGMAGVEGRADRLRAASAMLVIDEDTTRQNDLLNRNEGRSTDLGDRLAEQGRRRVRGLTGDVNIDSTPPPDRNFSEQAQRDIDALGTRVGAVRQQLETLPNSIRTRFIPELQRAQAELIQLQNSPIATVQAIENATASVQRLEAAAKRSSQAFNFRNAFGGAGVAGLNAGLNEAALQGYTAQLQVLQQALGRASSTARGPAVEAFNRLREAIATAMDRGEIETAGTRVQIERLTREAVAAAAAVSGIRTGTLQRQVQRAGDIGRAGFGNASLAINQLVFAVDDFFSVTGGAEQRIRALGNNITQFGFIVGGTVGLVAGLAAVLVAQGLVAFIRYSNGGATAADQTKALNAALQTQKTLVDQLAQSFESLGESLTKGIFTDARQQLEDFRAAIRDIAKQQETTREERVLATSPRAFREQAQRERLDREIEAEPVLARRQALLRQRRESEDIQRRIRDQIRDAPAPSGEQLRETVNRQVGVLAEFQRRASDAPSPRVNLLQAAAGRLPDGVDPASRRQQLAELDELLGVLKPIATDTFLGFRTLAARAVENTVNIFEQQAALIERELSTAVDADAIKAFESLRRASQKLAENVTRLEEASQQNIQGAAGALERQGDLAAALTAAKDRLVEASKIEDARGRADASLAATKEVAAIEAAIAANQAQVNSIESVRRSLDAFDAALDRVAGQLLDAVVGDARGAADQARRGANRLQGQAAAGFGQQRDADFALRQRRRQDQAAADIEGRAAGIEEQERRLRLRFQQAAGAGRLGADAQGLIRQRDAAQAVLDNRRSAPGDRVAAEGVVAEANRQLQQLFESLPEVQRLAGLTDALEAAAQGAIEFGNAVEQGRNLVLTDAQRVADDFIAQVQQINAALAAGEIDQGQRRAAIDRLQQDGLRQLAPNMFGLADQVQNAVLQGPSRAALQATDVSTVAGSSELNRLLRGEDSARDQPLIELQREANKIAERIARGVENNEAKIAN